MVVHFLLMDVTNARFLWKRVPADTKKKPEAKPLTDLWGLGKDLTKRDFSAAFKKLEAGVGTN